MNKKILKLTRENNKLKKSLKFLTLNCEHWLGHSVLDLLSNKSRLEEALHQAQKIVYENTRKENKKCQDQK